MNTPIQNPFVRNIVEMEDLIREIRGTFANVINKQVDGGLRIAYHLRKMRKICLSAYDNISLESGFTQEQLDKIAIQLSRYAIEGKPNELDIQR